MNPKCPHPPDQRRAEYYKFSPVRPVYCEACGKRLDSYDTGKPELRPKTSA